MTSTQRMLLAVALVATLAAAYWAPPPTDGGAVMPVPHAAKPAAPAAPEPGNPRNNARTADMSVLIIKPRSDAESPTQVFSVPPALPASHAPKTAAVAAPEPEAPRVPVLPFKVLGRYAEDGREAVFLQYKDQNFVARVGDVLLDQYKVEQISASAATLLYLPLNQRQTLDIGAPSAAQ